MTSGYYRFDPESRTLVDQMGIQWTKAEIEALWEACLAHLSRTDLELEALGRKSVEANCPHMVHQFNFDVYP